MSSLTCGYHNHTEIVYYPVFPVNVKAKRSQEGGNQIYLSNRGLSLYLSIFMCLHESAGVQHLPIRHTENVCFT